MAYDEIVWNVINQQFCAFKLKTTKDQNFCRNEYNVTGFCSRQSCPLANSRYATIRSNPDTGSLYLFVKTIERAHMPNELWERTKLSANYATALEQIDAQMIYWPKFLVHKCKQRLTRLTQVALRMQKLVKEEERLGERIVPRLAPKIRRREETRERKAEAAAKVERAIERELIERLKSGAYGDKPLNVEENVWKKVLRGLERDGSGARDKDLDEGIEDEEFEVEEEADDGLVEYVSDIDGESDDELDDDLDDDIEDYLANGSNDDDDSEASEESDSGESEDQKLKQALANLKRKRAKSPPAKSDSKSNKSSKKGGKGPRREIEYETETPLRDSLLA